MNYEIWNRVREIIEYAPIRQIAELLSPFMVTFGPFAPLMTQAIGYGSKAVLLRLLDALKPMPPLQEPSSTTIPNVSFGDKAFMPKPSAANGMLVTPQDRRRNNGFDPVAQMSAADERYYDEFIAPAFTADISGPFRPRPIDQLLVPVQILPGDAHLMHPKLAGIGNRGPNATYAGIGF